MGGDPGGVFNGEEWGAESGFPFNITSGTGDPNSPYMSNPPPGPGGIPASEDEWRRHMTNPYSGGNPGLEPWGYQVPNPKPPQTRDVHQGGGRRRRGNRRQRKRNRFFDELRGGHKPPNQFWDR